MRALVTGGAGFIGSNISDGLSENGAEVFIVDNLSTGKKENLSGKAEFFNVDITDKDALRKVFESVKPEIVFHLAAQIDVRKSAANPAFDASVNVIGAINVFELSVEYGAKRIVFSSTGGAIYGEPEKLPATEETEVAPLAPYGVSKYCGEQYLNYFKRLFGIERVILRYANVYGPRQDPLGEAGVVAIFTGKILRGENPVIFGDGEQTRDYVYVKDVVRANILAINGKEGTYNIGTGIETSVNELVKMFEKITGKEIIPQYAPPRKGEVRRISLSYEKAKKELGFEPEYSLEKGLRETLQW
ncbi:MAG: SDR family NAD(P)-dependent oxidoreductase, partial [Caldisericaceae bacterium]|nr:SDR family NAD(P)-dependent oxidoreductase [Caldisericaceae bacterium]